MGKLVFGMMQSLDGYVAGIAGGPELPPPDIALHCYFNDHVRRVAGSLYGRRTYEVMRYWDEDRPEWGAVERDFATAWRAQPKWIASRSLSVELAKAPGIGGGANIPPLGTWARQGSLSSSRDSVRHPG